MEEAKLTPPAVCRRRYRQQRHARCDARVTAGRATWHFLRRVTDFCTWTTCFDCHHRARVANAPTDLIFSFIDPGMKSKSESVSFM